MKPLMRWSIGPVKPIGFRVLSLSVKLAKKIFPEFDFVICYNQISSEEIFKLEKLEIELINSELYVDEFFFKPSNGYHVHWKLFPPRIRMNSFEIFLDNDVVLTKRPPEIDKFLKEDSTLLSQGLNANLHGQFGSASPNGVRINSGIFGLPPHFDLNERALKIAKNHNITKWKNKFDEQGLIAATLLEYPFYHIIPITTVPILEPNFSLSGFTTSTCCGYHFVQVNYKTHPTCKEFLRNLL